MAARRLDAPVLGHHAGQVEPGLDERAVELDRAGIVVRRFRMPAGCAKAVRAVEGSDRVGWVDGKAALVESGRLFVVLIGLRVLGGEEEFFEPGVIQPCRGRRQVGR